MSQVHRLKSRTFFFGLLQAGVRSFDVRLNDRKFEVGDMIDLHEWNAETETFTTRTAVFEIRYVEANIVDGINEGYVVLGLIPVQ